MSRTTPRTLVQEFDCTVPLLGVILKDGDRVKFMRVAIDEREYWIKIPKSLRPIYDPHQWQIGTLLQISGLQSIDRQKGRLELEATTWQKVEAPPSQPKPGQILICGKTDCWQKGGRELYQCLEQAIIDRGWSDQVRLQKTGCQKQCKQAPNLVIMPTKQKFARATVHQAGQILQAVLPSNPNKAE